MIPVKINNQPINNCVTYKAIFKLSLFDSKTALQVLTKDYFIVLKTCLKVKSYGRNKKSPQNLFV
jgi:hypothetical protein